MALDKPAKLIRVRPRASSDIDGLADYLAQDNLDAAIRFMDSLQNTLELIGSQPRIGSLRYGSFAHAGRLARICGVQLWKPPGVLYRTFHSC